MFVYAHILSDGTIRGVKEPYTSKYWQVVWKFDVEEDPHAIAELVRFEDGSKSKFAWKDPRYDNGIYLGEEL